MNRKFVTVLGVIMVFAVVFFICALLWNLSNVEADGPSCGPGMHQHDSQSCHIVDSAQPVTPVPTAPVMSATPTPMPTAAPVMPAPTVSAAVPTMQQAEIRLERECNTIEIEISQSLMAAIAGSIDGIEVMSDDDGVDATRTAEMTVCTEGFIKASVDGTITVK